MTLSLLQFSKMCYVRARPSSEIPPYGQFELLKSTSVVYDLKMRGVQSACGIKLTPGHFRGQEVKWFDSVVNEVVDMASSHGYFHHHLAVCKAKKKVVLLSSTARSNFLKFLKKFLLYKRIPTRFLKFQKKLFFSFSNLKFILNIS